MGRPFARALALSSAALFSFLLAPRAVAEEGPRAAKQVVTLPLDAATAVSIDHRLGDGTAILRLERAPRGALGALAAQTGSLFVHSEPLLSSGEALEVGLWLASGLVDVNLRVLPRPRALTLTFTAARELPRPASEALIGWVFGSFALPRPLSVLPQMPGNHPCRERALPPLLAAELASRPAASISRVFATLSEVSVPDCRTFLTAVLAGRALVEGREVGSFERWAFQLSPSGAWVRFGPAWGYTALVAAKVLLRGQLRPEAEVLLTDRRVVRLEPLAPYLALALAEADLAGGKAKDTEALLEPLSREEQDPRRLGAALLLRAMAAASTRQVAKVAALAEEALTRVGPQPWLWPLWSLGGEASLGMDQAKDSRRFFELAAGGARDQDLAAVKMRLGDLALRLEGEKGRPRARQLYDTVDTDDRCILGMLTLRRRLAAAERTDDLEVWLEEQSAQPPCPAVRADALFALARSQLASQSDRAALKAIDQARIGEEPPWGSADVLASLEREIISQGARRRARARDWEGLVAFYEELLDRGSGAIDAGSLLGVARAYRALGALPEATRVLLDLTRRTAPGDDQDEATVLLARTYLDSGDLTRAGMVTRFFFAQRAGSQRRFAMLLLEAERALRARSLDAAEGALRGATKLAAQGSPDGELAALKAELASLRGAADPAAEQLIEALGHAPAPDVDRRGLGVNVTSLCARECSPPVLERLLNVAGAHEGGKLITDRIRHLAAQRGVRPRPEGSDAAKTIWNELQAIATEAPRSEAAAPSKPPSEAAAPAKQ
jgi:hypothetical protein